MADVLAAVDSVTGAFGTLVQNWLRTDMQTAINTGVTNAIAGSGDTAAAVANALAPLTTVTALKAANALPSAAKNLLTGWFHADGYGAVGDGTTIVRTQIQAALNAAGAAWTSTGAQQKVYLPPGIYLVDSTNYLNDDGTTVNGAVSLMLPSGVDFFGPGTIKVKAGAYGGGALYGTIRSKSGGISNSRIRELVIDGNKANQVASTQCSNILLTAADDVEVSGTRQYNANGNGILITGLPGTPATNIRVTDNRVVGCTSIGIQVSRFRGLHITRNTVGDCINNGIDIYGENGNATTIADDWVISENRVYNCSVGIFPETSSWGIVANNLCYNNTESNIHVNRATGVPKGVTIVGNQCTGGPIGIYVTGDMAPGSIRIRGNTIDAVTAAGIRLGGGGASSSYVYIADNFIDTATLNTQPLIHVDAGTPVWSQTTIRRTITKNTNRSLDVYNQATSTVGSVSYDQANT